MKKTYIIPTMAECTVVERASFSEFKDPACKYPKERIAHAFTMNSNGCAQFVTEDEKIQAFLEARPMFKEGIMIVLGEGKKEPVNPDNKPAVRQGVTQTQEPAPVPVAPAAARTKKAGAKTAVK
jgi:hypothetical protein